MNLQPWVKRHKAFQISYPIRCQKCDIWIIDMKSPKHFVFLTCKHIAQYVLISEEDPSEIYPNQLSEIRNAFRICYDVSRTVCFGIRKSSFWNLSEPTFGYPKGILDMFWCIVSKIDSLFKSSEWFKINWHFSPKFVRKWLPFQYWTSILMSLPPNP